MLTTEQLKQLKQSNISADAEKTKQRVHDLFTGAKRAQQQEIYTLSGQSRSSIYRTFVTGSVGAKVAISIAYVLNIDPFYLTGEADELGKFSEKLLTKLLKQHNYAHLIDDVPAEKPKRAYTKKTKAAPEEAANVVEETVAPEPESVQESVQLPVAKLSEEKLQALLHALSIKADAGVESAETQLAQITGILLG